jgi:peptidoglycan hydrolase-like protein with peptidoglycan-binding domain
MRVRQNYPAIPLIPTIDGRFGASTDAAVRTFQEIFDLPVDGIVGKSTWYRLSYIYSAVIKLAEVSGEGIPSIFENIVPEVTISIGERSDYALLLQLLLNYISYFYPTVKGTARDGIFGQNTLSSLISFQETFGLSPTGIVNTNVWTALYAVYRYILRIVRQSEENQDYPGSELVIGSSSDSVRQIQTYLSVIADSYPTVSKITPDGVFGPATERAVISFQRSFGLPVNGKINAATWERIVEIYNFTRNQIQ